MMVISSRMASSAAATTSLTGELSNELITEDTFSSYSAVTVWNVLVRGWTVLCGLDSVSYGSETHLVARQTLLLKLLYDFSQALSDILSS